MKAAWFLLRLLFGAFFVFSGAVKLKDPILFAEAIRNYRILGDPIAPAMALFLPWLEIFAGIGLMIDRLARGAAFLLVASLVVFTLAIGIAWMRGLDITCGCYGGNDELNYPVKVAQNLGLILLGVLLWWKVWREGSEDDSEAA